MSPPIRPEPVAPPVNPFGSMGGETSTPLQPQQRMRAALQWLKSRGATAAELNAEIERWKPKIAEYNQREMAQAGSFLNLAAQGATANFGDEIAGAADAIGAIVPGGQSPAEAYRSTKGAVAGTNTALRETRPLASMGAEVAGAVGPGVATSLVGATRALPGVIGAGARRLGARVALPEASTALGRLGQRVAVNTIAGGTAGAVAGAGGAEEGERLRGAGTGALMGSAVATGLGLGGALVGAAGRRVGLGPRAPETVVGKVQGAVGATTPEQAAVERITRKVEQGGRSVDDVLSPTADLDPSAFLADTDVGGQQAARLLGTARRLGETADERVVGTMGARARDRGVKLGADLSRISGTGEFSLTKAGEDLVEQARKDARPLYEQVRQYAAVADPRVNEAIDLLPPDRIAGLWKNVRDIARLDGRKLTKDLVTPDGKLAYDLEPAEMDLLKRALDEVIYAGGRQAKMGQPGGLTNAETALLQRARGLIVSAAEDATGGPGGVYAQARAVFDGPVSLKRAMELGENLPKMSKMEVADAVAELTPRQREAFARGGVQALRETLIDPKTAGRTGIARAFTSGQREAQMEAAMNNPEKAAQFKRLIAGEEARERTEATVMRGSPTAERLADDELAQQALPTSRGGLISAVLDPLKQTGERLARGTTAAEMDAVSRVLTENVGDQATRARVLKLLREGKTARAEMAAKSALRKAGIVSGTTGKSSPEEP